MQANHPEFREAVLSHGPGYHVRVGQETIDVDQLPFQSSTASISFIPVIAGAKGGLGSIILGALLIAVSFALPGSLAFLAPSIFNVGASLVIGGLTQLLIGAPKQPTLNSSAQTPNYAFNGPVNTTAQGNSVPVLYGRLIIGSQTISAALVAEQTVGRLTPPTSGVLT